MRNPLTLLSLRRWCSVASICVLVFCFSAALYGQALSGITGTVTDASGAVVPNAQVTVTNQATQVATHATTSSAGTYTVTGLIPGTYTVQIEFPGFQLSVHNGVGVEVGKMSTVDAGPRGAYENKGDSKSEMG